MEAKSKSPTDKSGLRELLQNSEKDILGDWIKLQLDSSMRRSDLISEAELREQSGAFLTAIRKAVTSGSVSDISSPEWGAVRDMLTTISRNSARHGFTPAETATFVFSLKRPLFTALRRNYKDDAEALATEIWNTTELIDRLGLFTTDVYQKSREELIVRQQQEMLELSTPVVSLWEGILALPIIGTLDSARTQIVMESLLQRIVETGSSIAIIDITGVPLVDTLVAQHLLKTVAAARLMGADCIISGIRPQIAQTIVHLGVDLTNVTTKATIADAIVIALQRTGQMVVRTKQ